MTDVSTYAVRCESRCPSGKELLLSCSYALPYKCVSFSPLHLYGGVDKSLARPTFRCILFDGENISFDASLVLYIYI